MIEIDGLTKRYGDKTAVDGLSFVVEPGVVTGFLGPNGAGKSTTMRMIAGLDRPTSGTVRVNGKHYPEAAAPMSELGILLDARSVHPGLSARSNLLALARTAGIGRRRVDEVIELAGLAEVAGTRAGGFSLGMGQRLGVAAALLGQPQTVVLDEPVNGLDPDGVRWIRLLLKSLAAEGRTVFVSSHLMSEMAQTATRLVVLGRGQLISETSVEDFTGHATASGVLVRTPETARLGQVLAAPGVTVINDGTDLLRVSGTTAEQIGDGGLAGSPARVRAHPHPRFARGGIHASDPGQHRVPRRSDAMSAVMRSGVGRLDGSGPGDSGGTGYPGPRRPRGVDEAAGAALDLVVRASRGRADRRPGCRDRRVRDAVPRLGGQFRRGRECRSAWLGVVDRPAGARRARRAAVQRRIRHRDDPRHAGGRAIAAAGALGEADRAGRAWCCR